MIPKRKFIVKGVEYEIPEPKRRTDIEPTYGDFGEDGKKARSTTAKWQHPDGLQLRMLEAVDRQTYAKGDQGHEEKRILDEIVANSLPMGKGSSDYPEEWIIDCITWIVKMREGGKNLPLKALVGAVKNNTNKQKFLTRWSAKNGRSKTKEQPDFSDF